MPENKTAEPPPEPWKAAHDSAIEGLAMIWEAVETLGPPGALPSEEAVLGLYGPEPHHRAMAIVAALTRMLGGGVQPIATAPRNPEVSLQLFCPDQGGWHVGEWWPVDRPRWVDVIGAEHELQPTHWAPALPSPMTESEIIAWTVKGQTGPTEQ